MKTSSVKQLIAELQSERFYTEACQRLVEDAGGEAADILSRRMSVLDEMIARVSNFEDGITTAPAAPKRTRKARKAGMPEHEKSGAGISGLAGNKS